jgi:membrane protease YdiL (CAAX protease family)
LEISYIFTPDNFTVRFDIETFIPLLIISLCLIPLQTTFEEFLFRGYLTQGVAGWTKNRWLAICIPTLIFGLLHSGNKEIAEYGFWTAMPLYLLPGLIFGFIAVVDDGIELPIGMHAANNIFASVFVTYKASSLNTQAIITQETINPSIDTVALLISGLITIYFFSKIYKWDFNILNKKVQ